MLKNFLKNTFDIIYFDIIDKILIHRKENDK